MLVIELNEQLKAPVDQIWRFVCDPSRQREYVGYEVIFTKQTNAADPGAEYMWNEKGVLLGKRYDCQCQVFGWEPPQWYCFGTPDLFQVSFELEADGGDTKLLYRVELPQTPETRRDSLTEVCRSTIRKLKVLIEGGGPNQIS